MSSNLRRKALIFPVLQVRRLLCYEVGLREAAGLRTRLKPTAAAAGL
jgi:hypothetical protein